MAKADGGELVARIMRENRTRYCFAINGGHLFPILAQLRNHEIKLIHMRHEQATAYAADGYARMTGEVGVCMVTAGCCSASRRATCARHRAKKSGSDRAWSQVIHGAVRRW
jgi:TPP-dependent 2-oxoacid decarboxylase